MAVAATNLTAASSSVGGSSYTTASITPVAGRLYFATLTTRTGITADPTQPTCTGAGLTWVVVASIVYDNTSSSRRRLTVFRAMGTGSAGALTFDEAGQAQTHASWSIDELTGTDTTGTSGSGAVVQAVTNFDGSATVSSLTVTLAAFGSASNATFGAFGGNQGVIVGSGFTLLGNTTDGATNLSAGTEFNAANSTTVSMSYAANEEIGGIGIEVKAAGAAAATTPITLLMMGIGA